MYNILYFLWLYNPSLSYTLVLDWSNYNIKYICTIDTHVTYIPSPQNENLNLLVWIKFFNLTALKSNSNTVWFNFQTYIIFSINLVSLVTLRSSGTDILYGCHLLLDVCIIYFISCDCIMNSSLSYTIY